MHKKIFSFFLLFILFGCSKVESNDNYIELVNLGLTENKITNDVALGYQLYVPRGIRKLRDYDYNQVFLMDGDYMYLYVDVISYYYKKDVNVDNSYQNDYYFKQIHFNGKNGYLHIVKKNDDKYLVDLYYNYAKVEGYASLKKIDKFVTIASIIVNNIDYNKKTIKKILAGELGDFSEISYEVEKPEGASNNFSKYLEEYVQTEEQENKLPDE